MSSDIKIIGKTKGGKEIGYRVPDNSNLYEVCFSSGGEVPKELKGGWNDLRQLQLKVEGYITKSYKVKK